MFPLNLPNVLTLVRILLVPVVVVALLDATPSGSWLAAGVFATAALTDGLDALMAIVQEWVEAKAAGVLESRPQLKDNVA